MDLQSEDIIRNINTEDARAVIVELERLWNRKRVALAGHFTRRKNALSRLMISTMFGATDPDQATNFDYSTTTKEQLNKAKSDLDESYEKLGRLFDRVNELNPEDGDHENSKIYKNRIEIAENTFENIEVQFGTLKYKLIQQQQQQQPQVPEAQFKPVTALKPSYQLTFDHYPTELENFIQQYTSYSNASKMEKLPIPEQQAFLRQGIDPSIWTSIQDEVNDQIEVLENPLQRREVTCISLIRRQFQIKYPLIMRRYEFMTCERLENQTFTEFFSKLKNLAQAAQMENMTQNDYLIYRIICGINQKEATDKLLSIPQDNFNLEEIRRIAESMEAAKNYKKAITPNRKPAESNHTTYQRQKRQTWIDKHGSKPETNNDAKGTIFDKLKEESKCFRCGENIHKPGVKCPRENTVCGNCGKRGHIQSVCGQPKTQKSRHTTNYTHPQSQDEEHSSDQDSD